MGGKTSVGDGRKERKAERLVELSALKTKHKAQDRRSKFWIYGVSVVLILALIGSVSSVLLMENNNENQLTETAKKPIDGVQSFDGLSQTHTSTPLTFSETPPTGGDHAPTWIKCGIYTSPISTSEAVHSLEHGAVWIAYRPDLPAEQIEALSNTVRSNAYQLLSPYLGLSSPVVASAWGKQLKLESAQDPRLAIFLKAYTQGPQTPEPGAPC